MKTRIHTKAIALTALVTALSVPALASAKPAPDVFERAVARSEAKMQGYRLMTDTLGGNGVPTAAPDVFERAAARGQASLPDVLERYAAAHPYGSHTRPAALQQGYSFITDTLGGNGGPGAIAAPTGGDGFSWGDAGIGAGVAIGALALLAASLAARRQLRHRPLQTA